MSHDIEASYAATEVVNHILANANQFFASPPAASTLSGYAARESRHEWPFADGVVELIETTGGKNYSLAIEFKRPNEGTHGILTAIGQSHAYLRKGYCGSLIVVPETYPGLKSSGAYIKEVLDNTGLGNSIGVFTYSPPDMTQASPFAGKMQFHRPIKVDLTVIPPGALAPSRTETQWAHVREGSTDPDALFKYLQSVKLLGGRGITLHKPNIPKALIDAIDRLQPGANAENFLSNCPGTNIPDDAWRHFWFKYVLHDQALQGWSTNSAGVYEANANASLIEKANGRGPKMFFVGKTNSPKNKLVKCLNNGVITEDRACEELVDNYKKRAHSYREDLDTGCEHIGFVDSTGRLTDDGYRFVDACERFGSANSAYPLSVFGSALLKEGGFGAFLHYVYRLSEEKFRGEPLAFTTSNGSRLVFDGNSYIDWLEDKMVNSLRVMRKVSARGGQARRPFQAELAVLRQLKIVGKYRTGVGLEINWPEFQQILTQELGSV